jgi:DOMON domain
MLLRFLFLTASALSQATIPAAFESHFRDLGHFSKQALNSRVSLYWALGPESNDGNKTITIGVVSDSMGWFGFGLSDTGAMFGSDVSLFTMRADGTPSLENRHVIGKNTIPHLSTMQTSKLVFSHQTNGQTAFIFQRGVKAPCQSDQANIKLDGTGQLVIFAYGDINIFGQHSPTNRGNAFIDFSKTTSSSKANMLPTDAKNMSIITPAFTVLSGNVTSYCYRYLATNLALLAFHRMKRSK